MSALTLNISKRHRILMKNSSMPNPFWNETWGENEPYYEDDINSFQKIWQLIFANWRGITLLQITSSRHSKNLTTIGFRKGELNPFLFTDKLIEISQRNYFSVIICFDSRALQGKGRLDRKDTVSVLHPFFSILAGSQSFFIFCFLSFTQITGMKNHNISQIPIIIDIWADFKIWQALFNTLIKRGTKIISTFY